MIDRTVLAAAALMLSAATAQADCGIGTHLAMATADRPDAVAFTPAQMQGLRRHYIDLRKTAYDRCQRRHAGDAMAAKERCFRDTLRRLVTEAGDPSLTRFHGYIDRIARPSG